MAETEDEEVCMRDDTVIDLEFWAEADSVPADVRALLREAAHEIEELRSQADDNDKLLDRRWDADLRGAKKWQEATGKTLTWPDHAELVTWLLEQLDEKQRPAV
jgi:hypothetical protein